MCSRQVLAVSPQGLERYRCRAVILATGCREAPWPLRAAAGSRPAGIFNTAVVHRLLTLMRELPGRRVVVVGSEDVGLMAVRLLHLAGAAARRAERRIWAEAVTQVRAWTPPPDGESSARSGSMPE